MAAHLFSRTFLWNPITTKALASFLSRTISTKTSSPSLSHLFLNRLRPLSAVNVGRFVGIGGPAVRGLATRSATSSLNDNSPNFSNRPPKETILLDGCDFEHWLVVMDKPEGDPTRDEIIDRYIKTLATVVGSEDEARMKIYSVSTRCYFAFGALVDEETSYKLKELPGVRWVLPDSYLDVKNKDYGGEPFINGQAVPYDPKYHEEWIRNNSRANERNRRNDRPRNFDRSRNFERRRENMQNRDFQNQGMQNHAPNMSGVPPSSNVPPDMGRMSQNNMGGMPQNNYGAQPPPNYRGAQPPPNYGGAQPPTNNYGGAQPPPNNYGGEQPPHLNNYGIAQPPPTNNYGGVQPPPSNYGGVQPPPSNYGGVQPPPSNYGGAQPPPNYGGRSPNYNTGNMGGIPQNAGGSGNTPGNMQESADGNAHQNSYTPRQ